MKLLILILLFSFLIGPLYGVEEGLASWYGGKFQGRLTANGERFDTNLLTAAHKTLPFDTIVRVTNLENSRHVDVRINDRGPFIEGRIIDLSRAAAERIGMTGKGVAAVRVEPLSRVKADEKRSFMIQVGAYRVLKNAQKVKELLESHGIPVTLEKTRGGIVRVQVGNILGSGLVRIKSKLKELGFNTFLVKRLNG